MKKEHPTPNVQHRILKFLLTARGEPDTLPGQALCVRLEFEDEWSKADLEPRIGKGHKDTEWQRDKVTKL